MENLKEGHKFPCRGQAQTRVTFSPGVRPGLLVESLLVGPVDLKYGDACHHISTLIAVRNIYRGPRLASHFQLGKQKRPRQVVLRSFLSLHWGSIGKTKPSSVTRITSISLIALGFDRQNKTVLSNSYYVHFFHGSGVRSANKTVLRKLYYV